MNLNRRKQREQRFKSLSLKLPTADSTLAGEAIEAVKDHPPLRSITSASKR
jgi:hypothetical protein